MTDKTITVNITFDEKERADAERDLLGSICLMYGVKNVDLVEQTPNARRCRRCHRLHGFPRA